MNPRSHITPLSRRAFLLSAGEACLGLGITSGFASNGGAQMRHASGAAREIMHVRQNSSGQLEIMEGAGCVLRYNYAPVSPGSLLKSIAEPNLKYAVTRSDYIHPLFGLDGEILTRDWPVDHPHHRGIYWAWPEVDWRSQRGDLHALQKVFPKPTGQHKSKAGEDSAELTAENLWVWESGEELVREWAVIKAYRRSEDQRRIDLLFRFEALKDPVLIARRDATHYGGLNLRLSAIRGQRSVKVTDAVERHPRRCWSDVSGVFEGGMRTSGLAVIQSAANPCYPGDWVEYPELNWLQPTFPASGTRYELRPGKVLELRFRLVIHEGRFTEHIGNAEWDAAHSSLSR